MNINSSIFDSFSNSWFAHTHLLLFGHFFLSSRDRERTCNKLVRAPPNCNLTSTWKYRMRSIYERQCLQQVHFQSRHICPHLLACMTPYFPFPLFHSFYAQPLIYLFHFRNSGHIDCWLIKTELQWKKCGTIYKIYNWFIYNTFVCRAFIELIITLHYLFIYSYI